MSRMPAGTATTQSRPWGRTRLVLGAITLAGAVITGVGISLALLTDTAQIQDSTFATDTLNAPTLLAATGSTQVDLSWTATTDTYATGHRVYRATASGGPYSQIAELTPRTNVLYSDSPGIGTFYYIVRAYHQNWESTNSNEVNCTRVVALFAC